MASETTSVVVGAILGGSLSLVSSLVMHHLSGNRDREKMRFDKAASNEKWHREKLDEAFRNALIHIIRLRNIGPIKKSSSSFELTKEIPPEWLHDLSEARAWLEVFFNYCPTEYRDDIGPISSDLFNLFNLIVGFVPGEYGNEKFISIIKGGVLDYQTFCDYINSIESTLSGVASEITNSNIFASDT